MLIYTISFFVRGIFQNIIFFLGYIKLSNKKVRGKNKFQESWLSIEEYKACLEKGWIKYAVRYKVMQEGVMCR